MVAAIQADIRSPICGQYIFAAALTQLGVSNIDIIVDNTALADRMYTQPVADQSNEKFAEFMTGNIWTPVQLTLSPLNHMPKGGRVINILSMGSVRAAEDPYVMYGASKAALNSITRSFARMYAEEKLATFNSVLVGPVRTASLISTFEGTMERGNQLARAATAEKRLGEMDDVADIAAFIASPESRWINGEALPAHGGLGI